MRAAMNADDVILLIAHPFGDVEVSLSIIPLPYRNDEESRALIARGLLSDPWSTKPTSAT